MPVISLTRDPEKLTMTLVAEFPVTLQRLWDAYTDARQIEQFWGPPEYPATFLRHDVKVGGFSEYYMTGPEGDTPKGYWEWLDIKEPADGVASFDVKDGFGEPAADPDPEMPGPARMTFQFESINAGARVTSTAYFESVEQLERLVAMGMEEGTRAAVGQLDAFFTANP